MSNTIRILGISGSLRNRPYNEAALKAATELLPEEVSFEIFDLAKIPPFNIDAETQGIPLSVRQLRTSIDLADAILIATPEYNDSFSGVLKNALDWASVPYGNSPATGKVVGIIGATTGSSGTKFAQRHLCTVCTAMQMVPLSGSEVLISHAAEKFDASGRLRDSAVWSRLGELVRRLLLQVHIQKEDRILSKYEDIMGV